MSYTQILYQIVFGTKNCMPVLLKDRRNELFKHLCGILQNKNCHVYIINGVENHLHIVTHVHQTVAVADLIKDLKVASSKWIKQNGIFKNFTAWQIKYGAFTYSINDKDRLINYVKNQEKHHKTLTYREEFIMLLKKHKIDYDERYLF